MPGEGTIGGGGAPTQCDFPVGGTYCENTCAASPDDMIVVDDGCPGGEIVDVVMYDTFGDGWNDCAYTLRRGSNWIASGTLDVGHQETDLMCLMVRDATRRRRSPAARVLHRARRRRHWSRVCRAYDSSPLEQWGWGLRVGGGRCARARRLGGASASRLCPPGIDATPPPTG